MSTTAGGAVSGGTNLNTVSVTAAYTVSATDELILADATGGAFTVSLPLPSLPGSFTANTDPSKSTIGQTGNQGQRVTVLNVSATTVTVDGVKPSYIRAGGKKSLTANDSSATFVSDGTFWDCVASIS